MSSTSDFFGYLGKAYNSTIDYLGTPNAPASKKNNESSFLNYNTSSNYQNYDVNNPYDNPYRAASSSGKLSWWNTAKDYANKAGQYVSKGADYVRKPLDWLSEGYQSLPEGFQGFVEGKFGLGDKDKPRPEANIPTAKGKRFELGGASSSRARFQTRKAQGFKGANDTYRNNPLAAKLISDAALNKNISQIVAKQLNMASGNNRNISIQQARNAIRTRLSKGA